MFTQPQTFKIASSSPVWNALRLSSSCDLFMILLLNSSPWAVLLGSLLEMCSISSEASEMTHSSQNSLRTSPQNTLLTYLSWVLLLCHLGGGTSLVPTPTSRRGHIYMSIKPVILCSSSLTLSRCSALVCQCHTWGNGLCKTETEIIQLHTLFIFFECSLSLSLPPSFSLPPCLSVSLPLLSSAILS